MNDESRQVLVKARHISVFKRMMADNKIRTSALLRDHYNNTKVFSERNLTKIMEIFVLSDAFITMADKIQMTAHKKKESFIVSEEEGMLVKELLRGITEAKSDLGAASHISFYLQ